MSSILKAYRFCLRVKPAQEKQLRRYAGSLRWLWNAALAKQKQRHQEGQKYANYNEMARWLTQWRHAEATAWLAETPSHTQQQLLKRLDAAYKNFFKGAGGFPSFKKYGDNPGIRFPDPKQMLLDQDNGRIRLPKLGWLRLRQSQSVSGEIRNVALTQEGAKWFISIQVQQESTAVATGVTNLEPPTLGIDMGLAAFVATSTGRLVDPLQALKRKQCRLRRRQRSVSRKVKGSQNRKKAVAKLAALHRKIACERADWLHKLSTELTREHAVIAIEDLRIRSMSASAAGTVAAPGKNVAQKAGLNRGILDAAWGQFFQMLTYKTQWRGGRVIEVNPAYSSRTCRICGHEDKDNRKTQDTFSCTACGHTEHADVHAAQVILERGTEIWQQEMVASEAIGSEMKNSAAGLAVIAHGGMVRRPRRASAEVAVPIKWEPSEEVVV